MFKGAPKYLSKEPVRARSGQSTSATRLKKENAEAQKKEETFFAADRFDNFSELCDQSHEIRLPQDTVVLCDSGKVLFVNVCVNDRDIFVRFSLAIFADLSFSLAHQGCQLFPQVVSHLLQHGQIVTISAVSNILAHLNSMGEKCQKSPDLIKQASELLKTALQDLEEDSDTFGKLQFFSEQLDLIGVPKNRRRFSPVLYSSVAMWQALSPALYRHLVKEKLLTLPHENTLKRLTKDIKSEPGITAETEAYLKARISKLKMREKLIVLLIDEI